MNKKQLTELIVSLNIFLFLIATVASFAEAQKADISDGISAEKAVIISKNYMKDNGLDDNYVLFWPTVTEGSNYKNSWHVSFPPTVTAFLTGLLPFGVDVDKKTGEITSSDTIK